jgi:hypothetical protein
LPTAGQVNNAQPPHRQRQSWRARIVHQKTFAVRPAMLHGCGHGTNALGRVSASMLERDAADSAHAII